VLVATRSFLALGRLGEHFYQILSFNRMYPFCFTLDKRQSIGQKRTGSRAKQQPTGKPIVPQPERLNEISPAAEEVRDCPSEEEDRNGEEEWEPAEQGKGNWLRNSTLPFKGSTVTKPRPPRTGRKPKKRRTPNGCRMMCKMFINNRKS